MAHAVVGGGHSQRSPVTTNSFSSLTSGGGLGVFKGFVKLCCVIFYFLDYKGENLCIMKPQTLMSHMLGGGGKGGPFSQTLSLHPPCLMKTIASFKTNVHTLILTPSNRKSLGPNTAVSMSVHAVDASRRINLCWTCVMF